MPIVIHYFYAFTKLIRKSLIGKMIALGPVNQDTYIKLHFN